MDVHVGATRDEQLHHLEPAGAARLNQGVLVSVRYLVELRPALEQELDDRPAALPRSRDDWISVAPDRHIRVGATVEQQLDDVEHSRPCGSNQRAAVAGHRRVHARPCPEQSFTPSHVTVGGGPYEGTVDGSPPLTRSEFEFAQSFCGENMLLCRPAGTHDDSPAAGSVACRASDCGGV